MKKNKQATIVDVATEAGVSIATVSNVINRRKVPMSPETIRKVDEAVARLGYRRNVMATNLSRRRSNELGLILPHFGGYYGRFAEKLEQRFHSYGYHLSVFSAAGMDPEVETRHIEHLLQRRVDGLVSHGLAISMHSTQQLVGEGTPLVIFNGWGWPNEITKLAVNLDFAKASSQAVQYFLAHGCRAVFYAGRRKGMGANEQRIEGFLAGLGDQTESTVHALLDAGELGVSGTLDEALRVSGELRPIGIYTFNDALALELIAECHARGIRVPEDVQLIGMDNEHFAKASFPSITSFEMPVELQTRLVAAFLMRQIGEELDEESAKLLDSYLAQMKGHELLIDMEMVVRNSTQNK
ncbi:LacI family DNA-binding transcriptional regulator [Paenibacillus qinlingensis]|uniref:LacI family transcriptional regulator n=1 Tax=Paenibacillus qinlingensis TaxID=1837343 RepID=A0ABU1P5D9_9BACL|nr:LacI family DNA-binding transcriptional regulator [Paenibacillus qinlingensis]MDR6554918.1 LacI family transcriptional regulator [Paenibacillus qinlingensis]